MPTIDNLTIALTAAEIAVDDLVAVVDVSEANERKRAKKMRVDQLAIATGVLLAGTFQPLDTDLTAIAALTTTAFGRGLLTETDAGTLRTTLSVYSTTQVDSADSAVAAAAAAALAVHTGNTSNPHSVTKAQVGLGSVENTALSTWAGSTNLVTLGAVTAGSIGVGFGSINVGVNSITGGYGVFTGADTSTTDTGAIALKLGRLSAIPTNGVNAYIGVQNTGGPGTQNGDLIYIPRTTSSGNMGHRFYSESAGTPTLRVLIDNAGLTVSNGNISTGSGSITGGAGAFSGDITAGADIKSTGNPTIYSSNGGVAGTVQAGFQFVGSSDEIRGYTDAVQRFTLTTTGINNTVIGATTPAAGSFTTLAASTSGSFSGTGLPYLANSLMLRNNGTGQTQLWALGPDTSTNGTMVFVVADSDGSATTTFATGSNTGFAVTGTLTTTSVATVGNGAASTNGLLVLDGATTGSFGAQIRFNRGGTIKWQLGTESGIIGNNSNDWLLYDQAAGGNAIRYTSALGLTINGKLGIATGANTDVGVYNLANISGTGTQYAYVDGVTFNAGANNQSFRALLVGTGVVARSTFTGLDYRAGYISTPTVTGTGTIANAYQLYIEAAPAATNKWGIYQTGTDANVLGGTLTLGTTANFIAGASGTVNPGPGFDAKGIGYSASTGLLSVSNDGAVAIDVNRKTSDGGVVEFRRAATSVGSISVTTTSTAYNTSSNALLKTDLGDFSLAAVAAPLFDLKLRKYRWKVWENSEDEATRARAAYGVFAQEALDTCPWMVTHEGDNWAVNWMALTPNLVAAVQVHKTEIDLAKERITALEKELASLKAA